QQGELSGGELDTSAYLLVIDGASSRRCALPREGVLFVGRSSDAEICVAAAAASRRHAKFLIADGEVQVIDLKSHNGTLVNGERLEGSRLLSSGDVVTIGDAVLILRREPRAPERALVDAGRWRRRLEEEIERAGDYGRPLAVAVVSAGGVPDREAAGAAAAAALRLIDVLAWDSGAQLVVLMPELGAEAARAATLELLEALAPRASGIRGGVAAYPADGGDAETFVSGAAAAAAIAGPGAVALAADTAVRHRVGEREVVLADPAMIRVFELIRRLAASDLSVLVLGETGAGKENAAAALHHWSARASKPLITLNCAALPEALVESELFGYERGAFSDARAPKPGLLERAHGGTVFLDEIGELPLGAQAWLPGPPAIASVAGSSSSDVREARRAGRHRLTSLHHRAGQQALLCVVARRRRLWPSSATVADRSAAIDVLELLRRLRLHLAQPVQLLPVYQCTSVPVHLIDTRFATGTPAEQRRALSPRAARPAARVAASQRW
ncbi:MAG TPA: FHA domain-containing protein, partial [Sorangium sp.]|nr:FHA domain-containing protein [Sorangium sp.]